MSRLLGALALGLALAACAPKIVMREGVRVPYEQVAEQDLRKAQEQTDAGQIKAAQATLERFLVDTPESRRADEALFLLGELYLASGDREKAALAWRRLLRDHPRSRRAPDASYRTAQAYREIDRPELGWRILSEAAFERAPQELRIRMYRLLADLARATGDYAAAVEALALTRREVEDEQTISEIDLELDELIRDRLREPELAEVSERLPRGPVYDRVVLQLAERKLVRGEFSDALATLDRLPQRLRPTDERERQNLRSRALRGAETAVYTVGVALPLSGPFQGYGESALHGVILGLEVLADPPGRYRIVVRDTEGDPAVVGLAMRQLVKEGSRVIIGPMRSIVAASAARFAERAGVPMLTLAQREDIPELGRNIFRLGLAPSVQAPLLVDYALKQGSARRFAVLYPRDSYGTSFKNLFWDEMERRGGEIAGVEGYAPDAVDLQTEIKKLVGLYYVTDEERALLSERDRLLKRPAENERRLAEPEIAALPPYVDFDALFIPDVAERVGLILPQLRFFDISDVLLLGPNDWNDPRLLKIDEREANGAVFVGAFYAESDDPAIQAFVSRFYAAFGTRPDLPAAIGYDAASLIQISVNRLGHPSSRQLRGDLEDVRDFSGMSGLTGFDDRGVPRRELQLLQVQGKEIRPLNGAR